MNNEKTITAVIAFAVAFIFSTGLVRIFIPPPLVSERAVLVQTKDATAVKLERFIAKDANNATNRNDRESSMTQGESVTEYWRKSSSMNTSEFSPEFVAAWDDHMNAWRDFAVYLRTTEQAPETKNRNTYKELDREISRTWANVINIARKHGADVTY